MVLLCACSWVELQDGANRVRVVDQPPENCQRLGSTIAFTQTDIGLIDRDSDTVKTELETLARNAAARKGGDTVHAETEVSVEGEQTFGVYACQK